MACSSKTRNFSLYIADAFTKHSFSGNSAAVCLIPHDVNLDNDVKQKIAMEMNLSETAFVQITDDKDSFETGTSFNLNWFTPTCEVPLCGHATLASSAVLFKELGNKSETLEFYTVSGVLKARNVLNNRIQIDLPAYESTYVSGKYINLIQAVVGNLPVADVALSETNKVVIRLCDNVTRKEFERIKTNDAELLAAAPDVNGAMVTLKGTAEGCVDDEGNRYDFVSRYFGPWWGVSEDPVTGSAHSVLAPFWAKILGKKKFYARQCSARGGELYIDLEENRILLTGDAVVVVKGEIRV